jgi:cobaltochelatase CobS
MSLRAYKPKPKPLAYAPLAPAEPAAQPASPAPVAAPGNDPVVMLQAALAAFATGGGASEARIREIAAAEVAKAQLPTVLEIRHEEAPAVLVENPHPMFQTLLAVLSADVPVWAVGPAGSGKTHAAQAAAKALGLAFHMLPVCSQTGLHHITGFVDAAGRFHETPFTKAFRDGGLFLIDEIDRGNPNVLLALNAALANGHATFGNGEHVARHASFRAVACANTYGTGANAEYVGACKIDAATTNRFATIVWDYDAALELALTGHHPFAVRLQAVRARAARAGVRVIVSTRSILNAVKLATVVPDFSTVARMLMGAVDDVTFMNLTAE